MCQNEVFNSKCVDLEKIKSFQSSISFNSNVDNYSYTNKILKRISKIILNNDNTYQNSVVNFDLSKDNFVKIINYTKKNNEINSEFKKLLRINPWSLNNEIRKYLWKCLLHTVIDENNEDKKLEYDNDIKNIFGENNEIDVDYPKFVSFTEHSNYYYLNLLGKATVKRILCVYSYHYPDITFSPVIISITSLLLHYMQEHEVYESICYLFSKKDYLVETKLSWEANIVVFNKLLKTYCKSNYDIIEKYAVESIDNILNEWPWWIYNDLQFDYIIKIMDCFFYEGQKVLFRIGLAIVQLYTKTLEIFDDYLNESFNDDRKNENIRIDHDAIKQFCHTSIHSIEKLLKTSFNIRNLKRSTIKDFKDLYLKEMKSKANMSAIKNDEHNKDLTSVDSSTLDYNNTENNKKTINNYHVKQINTNILSHANFCTLWNWLPQRFSINTPCLIFTTSEHGNSLNTFYSKIENIEYCLIVVKTTNNEIFGAFCSGLWSNRKNIKSKYFGNGETFLFTIAPKENVYKWVGLDFQEQKTTTNQDMFIRADNNQIVIGGGGNDGLVIEGNLCEGHSNRCDTFNNDILSEKSHFQINAIEVITFDSKNN